jgi:alpha-beta hydrolase superfamily lysophospholipase
MQQSVGSAGRAWLGLLLFCCLSTAAWADSQPKLERLTVESSGQPLAVWSRRSEHPRGVVVLVHGRTWSARTAFDFESHGASRSWLKALSAAHLATYAVDLRGYGETPRDATGWITPTTAAQDVEAVLSFVAHRHPGLPPPVLLGWSRGSKISALVATRAQQPLTALILYAYTLDPNAPPANGPAMGKAPAAANTAAAAREDFISPQVASSVLIQDFVDKALAVDPTRVDVCCDSEFLQIRPEAIHVPTLLIQGARDPAIKRDVAAAFFAHLGAEDRRWVVVGRGDHAAHLEDTAAQVTSAVTDFIAAALTGRAEPP